MKARIGDLVIFERTRLAYSIGRRTGIVIGIEGKGNEPSDIYPCYKIIPIGSQICWYILDEEILEIVSHAESEQN